MSIVLVVDTGRVNDGVVGFYLIEVPQPASAVRGAA